MAFATRIPGMVNSPEGYWTALCNGYDGVIRIPLTRWDHDFYWQPEPDIAAAMGKAYVQHMGLTDNDTQMFCFDNEFFGITEEEVTMIDPPARCSLEVGYDCLYRAGYTRQNLKGASLVAVHGLANSEFSGQQIMGVHMPMETDTYTMLHISATASRLHYIFGMQGRTATVETACSSSLTAVALVHTHLRPDELGQMKLGAGGSQTKAGFATGANGHFDPGFMVGLCGAKMLSIQGRCFTFDSSGDGFCRGEGHCAMYFKCSEGEDLGRLAMLCGTCMNQDGRSASMTAPHGPSQQECIRKSLREAAVPALLIQMQELHGTGTALGDPIEVGALRATMMTIDGVVREHPLVKTSSKSNCGHTEMNAGLAGIIKCVMMACYCDACPNNHIRLLNPHIDADAYPVYFVTESVDQGLNNGYVGVSSFGFGGSNARGDIWARGLAGPRSTNPGEPAPQFNRQRAFVWNEVSKQSAPRMRVDPELEHVVDNLEDYDDAYLVGEQPSEDDTLYCIGSFNGWTLPEKMTWHEDTGCYVFPMPLGEACVEQFQIVMNKNEYFKIFPAAKMAGQDAIVLGPGVAPVGNVWVIDGRPEKIPHGTIYQITLQWDLETRKKVISWEPSLDSYMTSLASELQPWRHRYYIVGSWSNWKQIEMTPVRAEKPGTFQATVRLGIQRREEFRFQRDRDKLQSIYPARVREIEVDADDEDAVWQWTEAGIRAIADDTEKYDNPDAGAKFTPSHLEAALAGDENLSIEGLAQMGLISNGGVQSVPVCGPDFYGEKKHWVVSGFMGEEIKILLRVWEGQITVNTINARVGIRTWTSQQAEAKRRYFVTGSWDDWGFSEMRPSARAERAGVHKIKIKMEESRMMAFQIVVDEDRAQTIHPEMALTDQLLSPALGPDAKGDGLFWGVHVKKGDKLEIKLDLSKEDKRKAVTWTIHNKH
uniref:Ketosynthase family 3 (KS3) domain-containing protein n=1 Tax=Alexandrium catenella TaxID=2925 RepID=A0A7S1RXI7_ALECA